MEENKSIEKIPTWSLGYIFNFNRDATGLTAEEV